MLNSSAPFSLIYASICPFHLSISISLVFFVLTFVGVSAGPNEHPISMLLVVKVISFILIAWLRSFCTLPASLSVLQTTQKFTNIERAIIPCVLSFPIRLTILVLSCIGILIFEDVCSLTML
jgi:hypothetical protein